MAWGGGIGAQSVPYIEVQIALALHLNSAVTLVLPCSHLSLDKNRGEKSAFTKHE
jgi:hypothetical protein